MDVAPTNSVERIVSRRSLVRGKARIAVIWSVLAAAALLLFLLHLNLMLWLWIERGRLDVQVAPKELPRFERLTGITMANPAVANLPEVTAPTSAPQAEEKSGEPAPTLVQLHYHEYGLLPAVWHTRNTWWGGGVAFLYRNVYWLQSNVLALAWILCVASLVFIFRNFCLRQLRSYCHQSAIDAVTATRRSLHRQVLRLGPEDLDGTGDQVAVQLFTGEIDILRKSLYETMSRSIRFPLELLALALVLLSLDWVLALQWIAPAALMIVLINGVRLAALKRQNLAEDRARAEFQILLASLQKARMTRGYNLEDREHEQFQIHLNRYNSQLLRFAKATDIVEYPQYKILISSVALLGFLLFLVGARILNVDDAPNSLRMNAANALTFVIAAFLATPGIIALRSLRQFRHDLRLAADKIHRYLEQIPAVSQAVGAKFLQPMGKTLHFEHVKYQTADGRIVLDGVDFKLQANQSYAIVSVDPLEARAVALMLPRFIEPRQGHVLIDGEDIAWVTLESLRAETVFVAAGDSPFDGTVLDNIRGGNQDLTLQQATEAAKITRAHNFIVKLFNGYETVLASHGDSLDVGQRFRLNLARALARDPAMLIIEEPTEQLDDDTKTLLIDAYDRICRDRTVIFLPGRMATVRRTDAIVVLHEGKVAAFGPHGKLVKSSAIYRHWEYLRFNEFRHESPDDSA